MKTSTGSVQKLPKVIRSCASHLTSQISNLKSHSHSLTHSLTHSHCNSLGLPWSSPALSWASKGLLFWASQGLPEPPQGFPSTSPGFPSTSPGFPGLPQNGGTASAAASCDFVCYRAAPWAAKNEDLIPSSL